MLECTVLTYRADTRKHYGHVTGSHRGGTKADIILLNVFLIATLGLLIRRVLRQHCIKVDLFAGGWV